MYYGPTSPNVADEVKARLEAARARDEAVRYARQEALNRMAGATALVALLVVGGLVLMGGRYSSWPVLGPFGLIFGVSFGLVLARALPFPVRSLIFGIVLYATAVTTMITLGQDSGGWLFLIGFAVAAAMLWNTRAGMAAALVSLATWAGIAYLRGSGALPPVAAGNPFAGLEWLVNAASLAVVMTMLIWPLRLFLEVHAAEVVAARARAQPAAKAAQPPEHRPEADTAVQKPAEQPAPEPELPAADWAELAPETAAPAAPESPSAAGGAVGLLPAWLRDWWGQAALVIAGYVALYAVWTFVHWGGPDSIAFISDVAFLPVSLFAAVCAWRVAGNSQFDPQLRSAWLIFGFTAVSQFAADLVWFIFEIVLHTPAFPSPADILYLSFYPLALWGLLSLPGGQVQRKDRARFWLLLAGLMVVASTLIWQFIVIPVAAGAENDLLVEILSAAYPIGDIVILGGALSILVRRPPASVRRPLFLYLAGLLIFFGGDLLYAVAGLNGTYASGDPLDATWVIAYLLFGLAALQQYYLAQQTAAQYARTRGQPSLPAGRVAAIYMVTGVLFGLAFPVAATLLDLALQQLPLSLASISTLQSGSPLHWIIDTAPLILGLVFGLGGLRQDQAERSNAELAQEIGGHQRAIRQLQRLEASLKHQVLERTADFENTARQASRRADQLAVSAEVARAAAALQELPELLSTTARLISARFDYYHTGIFLIDDAGEYAVLQAASSPGGQRMLARNHRLRVGQEGLVGFVTSTGQPRIAFDVGADAVHFRNPDLPETHSEAALPLKARGRTIGALDVQSTAVNAYTDDDVQTLLTLANLIAVAIDNARLLAETRQALEETRAVQQAARRATRADVGAGVAYRYDGVQMQTLAAAAPGEAAPDPHRLEIPIRLGDEALGLLELKREEAGWTADDVELTEAVAARMALALENARLFETTRLSLAESEQLLKREQAVIEIGARLQQASSVKNVLQITAQELRRVTGSVRATVRLRRDGERS